MHVAVVTPPDPIITLARAKSQLQVEHSAQDDVISGYVAAATQFLDGPDGYLRRSIGTQVLAATIYDFPMCRGADDGLMLPYPPVTGVNDITYVNAAGDVVHVDPDAYELTPDGRLRLAYGQSWPARRSRMDPITVTFTAGYAAVPAPILTAVLLHVSAMFDAGDENAGFPKAAKDLVGGTYRLPRV